jgi:biotin operon repressor
MSKVIRIDEWKNQEKSELNASHSKKRGFCDDLLELIKEKPQSVNGLAKKSGKSEAMIRTTITILRRHGNVIVYYPNEGAFGFEEGTAPPLGPVGGGDDRWKRWA